MRNWFAWNEVEAFSISVWFKRANQASSGIVNNGDCLFGASFDINVKPQNVYSGIGTESQSFNLASVNVRITIYSRIATRNVAEYYTPQKCSHV